MTNPIIAAGGVVWREGKKVELKSQWFIVRDMTIGRCRKVNKIQARR
jgi:hypothetical protein